MLTTLKQQLETFLLATQGKRRTMSLVWLVLNMCTAPFFAFLPSPHPYPWLYLMVSPR